MTRHLLGCCALLFALTLGTDVAWGQHGHSDIEFEYHAGHIEIEGGPVFEGNFPTSGLFARFSSDPGFESHHPLGAGDIVSYNVLENLYYWNELTNGFADPGSATITIENAIGSDTIVGAGTGILNPGGIIGQADGSGNLHAHVDFLLSSSAAFGAYGLLLELATDDPLVGNSDPFVIVFNYGLSETVFETAAVPAFEALVTPVPEPSSFVLAALGTAVVGYGALRRRRST